MKKIKFFAILIVLVTFFCAVTACRPDKGGDEYDGGPVTEQNVLVTFFSRADENYSVGYIEKGNTHVIAEIIAEYTGGELFHIERKTPYPSNYNECVAEAQREKDENVRPELLNDKDVSDYDIIFIGYPIWHGDLPMPVYTFIEANDWNDKTVIPFCTHEGSGISGTQSKLRTNLKGASVLDGLAIRGATAQNNTNTAKQDVLNWLDGLGL